MAANSGLVDEYLEPGFATRVGTRRRLERLSAEVKRSEASHEGEKCSSRLLSKEPITGRALFRGWSFGGKRKRPGGARALLFVGEAGG
jgi:hypothetical protein